MIDRSENYLSFYETQGKALTNAKPKNEVFISGLDLPSFSYPKVVKQGFFKEYYGEVTSVEVFNTLRGWVVEVRGYHDSLFGREEFSMFEEDCFAGGDPYTAYFKTEEDAWERKQKVMQRKLMVL